MQSTLCIHKVEETLKREVGTPRFSLNTFHHRVEEALKREVGTPVIPGSHTEFLVEEANVRRHRGALQCPSAATTK